MLDVEYDDVEDDDNDTTNNTYDYKKLIKLDLQSCFAFHFRIYSL